jgi:hypothetical protein
MTAAKPIPAQSRDAFLRDVSIELSRFEVIGPGLVARACSKIQRQYLNGPQVRRGADRPAPYQGWRAA